MPDQFLFPLPGVQSFAGSVQVRRFGEYYVEWLRGTAVIGLSPEDRPEDGFQD